MYRYCGRALPQGQVKIDDVAVGTCGEWGGEGKLVRAGQHDIWVSAKLPSSRVVDGWGFRFSLRDGEVKKVEVGVPPRQEPPY